MNAAARLRAESSRLEADARLLAVLGDPVDHSLSPAIHGAALDALSLPHRYLRVRCPVDELASALDAARRLPVLGLNLTAPLKRAALPILDALSADARTIGAVNTVTREGKRLRGSNTDVGGFRDALRAAMTQPPEGQTAVVLGTGGAARAVVVALLAERFSTIALWGRSPAHRDALITALSPPPRPSAPETDRPSQPLRPLRSLAEAPRSPALVVQCTTVGLAADSGAAAWDEARRLFEALPWTCWAGRPLAFDLNYAPRKTAFLHVAAEAGCATVGGLEMLVHQAGRSFTLWTGSAAPIEVMRRAAIRARGLE